jgi:MFS family permease
MGGTGRVVSVVGPLYGGLVAVYLGYDAVFYSRAVVVACSGLLVLYGNRFAEAKRKEGAGGGLAAAKRAYAGEPKSLMAVARGNWRAYATIGVVSHSLMAIRTAKKAVLPLMGRGVGLDVAGVGVALAIGAVADALLFTPVGVAFDLLGRKRVAVPAMFFFTLGYLSMAFADGPVTLVAASVLVGVGNGMTAGFGQIMAADMAPEMPDTAKFLSLQAIWSDLGSLQAPIVVGAISEQFAPTGGALYLALLASIGFCWLALLLREPTIGFQKFGSGPGEGIYLGCRPAICGHCFRSGSIRPPRQPVAASP